MGEGTSVARAEAVARTLAAREVLDEELVRLEASARAAVDVPAKIKKHPVKAAGLAAGTAFVVVGGPKKVFRGAKRAIFGPEAPLPPSMLPKEIDESLRKLGTDGDRVRGLLEREFAAYLEDKEPQRRGRDFSGAISLVLIAAVRPLVLNYSKRLANQVLATDATAYADRLAKVRERVGGRVAAADGAAETPEA